MFISLSNTRGITNDLNYCRTLDKCKDTFPIRMIWVDGFSYFMEFKGERIDKSIEHKVRRLINDNKVGYITEDSFGCYLCCRTDDYKNICKYLGVECNRDDEDNGKEYYYNNMFDDILLMFREFCEIIPDDDVRLYKIVRYIIVNLDEYTDHIMKIRVCNEDDEGIATLWLRANEDYNANKYIKTR